MELSNVLPCLMLMAFSALSLRAWQKKNNPQILLTICIGWAAIAVLSLVFCIGLLIFDGMLGAIFLFFLSCAAAFVATLFKNRQDAR